MESGWYLAAQSFHGVLQRLYRHSRLNFNGIATILVYTTAIPNLIFKRIAVILVYVTVIPNLIFNRIAVIPSV